MIFHLAVRIDARVPAPAHTSRRRRRRRACAAQRAARAESRSGRPGRTGCGRAAPGAGRSAAAGTATNGAWCSSAPAGTSAAARSFAAAFPDTPWIWVQRDPARVVASLLANPPGWLGLQAAPQRAARCFGLDPAAVPAMTRAEFAARALGAMLEAAATDPAGRVCVDYADLPAAVWQCVTPHFGLEADPAAIARMAEESRFYAKDPAPRVFAGDVPQQQRPVTDADTGGRSALRRARLSRARFA